MPTLVVCDQCGQTAMVLFAMADLAVQRHNAACIRKTIDSLERSVNLLADAIDRLQEERE